MSPALRIHLLLLLTLPALLLPRGLELGWCLCDVPEGVTCCAPVTRAPGPHAGGCCATDADDDAASRVESDGALDCPGCHSIEVQNFEELFVSSAAPEIHAPAPIPGYAAHEKVGTAVVGVLYAPLRAPPGAVRPAGLLPGISPLRI